MKTLNVIVTTMISVFTSSGAADAINLPQRNARSTAGFSVLASRVGAALDSDLLKGGGSDDTAVLQSVLDRAADGTPVRLLIDGPALVSGINVYSHTTVECINGGGLYLKSGSGRSLIRNAHRSREAIIDKHITVRGCFLNGNRNGQPFRLMSLGGISIPHHREADQSWMSGLQFHGVNDLVLESVTLWNIRTFGATISNAHRIAIRDLMVDHGADSDDVDLNYANVDGVHFFGPASHITIDGVRLRTADDGLAFTANDGLTDDMTVKNEYGPYVGQGPITDVTVNNVVFMNSVQGIRFLSSKDRIDRVVISNVVGTIKGSWFATISHFMAPDSLGNIGSITFDNVSVSRTGSDAKMSSDWTLVVRHSKSNRAMYEEFNEGIPPLFNINAHVENLSVRNFSTRVADGRPILRLGPDAKVQLMTAELNLQDPDLKGVPLELDAGSHIGRLNFSVTWQGSTADQSKNPIISDRGTIDQLNWVATPPMFVDAEVTDARIVRVTFSQSVKGVNLVNGVEIQVNGRPARIVEAVRLGAAETVHYRLATEVRNGDLVTWAYDGTQGFIQNVGGDDLLSVAAKTVRTGRAARFLN